MRIIFPFAALLLSGCGQSHAVNACEIFIKENLRSPSTYNSIDIDDSMVVFQSGGRDVRMVSINYDAANAYGTPIRGDQQCMFEVDNNGKLIGDVIHAARLAAIKAKYASSSCCIMSEIDKTSDPVKDAEAALKEIEEAQELLQQAERDAVKAAERAAQKIDARDDGI